MKKLISSCAFAVGLAIGLSACTDPYDPGQRAIGGGLFGAGTGAAIGGIAGGGRGAATGALIGGALGAVGGAATTPSPNKIMMSVPMNSPSIGERIPNILGFLQGRAVLGRLLQCVLRCQPVEVLHLGCGPRFIPAQLSSEK